METISNILIVDDHKDFREAMKAFILAKGVKAQIWEAMTGQEGLDIVHRKHPRIAIIDLHLAIGLSGLETATQIKREEPTCSIIILSMYIPEDLKDFRKVKNVEEVIDKGHVDDKLIPVINRLLSSVKSG